MHSNLYQFFNGDILAKLLEKTKPFTFSKIVIVVVLSNFSSFKLIEITKCLEIFRLQLFVPHPHYIIKTLYIQDEEPKNVP